jgi:hypothetical protein
MKKLTDFWAHITGKDSLQLSDRAANSGGPPLTIRAFLKTFGRCPICDLDFLDHYFALLSVIPAYKSEALTALIGMVKNHQWPAAREIREFEPTQDAITIQVLRCPCRKLAVVIMENPYEPYYNPSIIDHEVLDEAESQELRTVLGETQWSPIK